MSYEPGFAERRLAPVALGRGLLFTCLFLFLAGSLPAAQQTLSGHVPAAVTGLPSKGRIPATRQLELSLALPLHDRDGLVKLIDQMYDPGSTNFHRYLVPEQFAARFGPTDDEYEAVQAFARSNHLTMVCTFSNRALLSVSGRVADIEAAFQVTLRSYQHPREHREFFAPDTEPKIDAGLPRLKIEGLDDYVLPQPGAHPDLSPPKKTGAASGGGSAPGGFFWGSDFRNAYAPGVTLTGAGQNVALFELDGFYANDITAYENGAGLPQLAPTVVKVGTFNGLPSTNANAVGEVSLDIEAVIAMAPGIATLLVYEGNSTASILARIAQDNQARQISSSWFFGRSSNYDTQLLQMAAQGQTFFECSGDNLAYVNGINSGPNSGPPADDPYLVSVGGTILTTAADKSWFAETTWNNANGVNGSGGGISTVYNIPTWQQNVSMTANGGSTSQRNIPDVSMVAYNCFFISNNGSSNSWWGTSIAAPLWAGFAALINQQASFQGRPAVGFLNPALYALGEGPNYSTYFRDVTTGNNTWTNSPGSYYATTGYDLCTGWGSPTGSDLINALAGYGGPVFVDFNATGATQNGQYDTPYHTLLQGVSAVAGGGTVFIERAGSSSETMFISKPMDIKAMNGPATIGH